VLWADFDRQRAGLLGALLNALAAALAVLPEIKLSRLPRMADFALLGVAAEHALSWPRGSFLAAYSGNREAAHGIVLDSSPVVAPLCALADAGTWTGTATELLDELGKRAGDKVVKSRDWPTKARALMGRLRRLLPSLRAVGVNVVFGQRQRSGVPITISRT
jgi:hypothetical protein